MALAKYSNPCGANTPGYNVLALLEVSSIDTITITSGEVTAITFVAAAKFREIDCDLDTLSLKSNAKGKFNVGWSHEIDYTISKASKTLTDHIALVQAALPCGLLALMNDNNGLSWIVGYEDTTKKQRPIHEFETNYDGGLNPTESDKNNFKFKLMCSNTSPCIPLSTSLSSAITARTSVLIDWNS